MTRHQAELFPLIFAQSDEAVTLIPETVVEVVSRGSERKDLELSPPF